MDDLKTVKDSSQLFYDASGNLRASINVDEYGNFNLKNNLGGSKDSVLTLDNDGTLTVSGDKLCLGDTCIDGKTIELLKEMLKVLVEQQN